MGSIVKYWCILEKENVLPLLVCCIAYCFHQQVTIKALSKCNKLLPLTLKENDFKKIT